MIAIVNGGAGGGGGDVTELLTPGTMQPVFDNLADGTHTITAGAYRLRVYNAGLTDITANGATVYPGETWQVEARENRTTTKFDLCPEVEIIIPPGGTASYQAEYPSA
ncbi:MAG: hypothetical protein HUU01_10330 [Saprospiraceae bacterium]|nr:hypothetical protein [Saprospiraceae bacterium]